MDNNKLGDGDFRPRLQSVVYRAIEKPARTGAKGKTKRISYEVRKGDTLFSIGKRYNVSVKQIRHWNSASRGIQPGQDLVIYVASNGRSRQGRL